MRSAFADTMLEVGKEDDKLVVLVGDISHNILKPFAEACPNRYYNVGIMEPTIVGMAAGLAMSGLKPVAHTIAPFLIERSFEQLKLDFGYQQLGGVMVSVGGAFDYSQLGCSHHTALDVAMVKSIERSIVICPASPKEFNQLFRQTYKRDQLTYFRLSDKHGLDFDVKVGKAAKLKHGNRVTVVAVGPQLKTVLDADIPNADVLYLHTVKPLDVNALAESYNKTGLVVVVEEHCHIGSVQEEIAGWGWKTKGRNLPARFQRGYGQKQDHLNMLGFTPELIRDFCRT